MTTYLPALNLAGICLLRVLSKKQPGLVMEVMDEMHKVIADGYDTLKDKGPQAFEDELMKQTEEMFLEIRIQRTLETKPDRHAALLNQLNESTKG